MGHSGIQLAALLFPVFILLALAFEPVARRFRLSLGAVLVAVGFAGSEIVTGLGFDIGLRWHHFHDLVLYVLVPVLVFAAALQIDPGVLRRHLVTILVLAVPLFLLAVTISTWLGFMAIGHPSGFPLMTAAIAATLIAATDPSAVISLLRAAHAPERLIVLLEGESLFNDALAIVLFSVLLATVQQSAVEPYGDTLGYIGFEFLRVFLGGTLVGAALGLGAYLAFKSYKRLELRAALTFAAPYLAYSLAESLNGLSGVMAVLLTGLWMGAAIRTDSEPFVRQLWGFIAFLAESIAFLLLGVTVTFALFHVGWLAVLIGVGIAILGRSIAIYVALPLFERLPIVDHFDWNERRVLFASGQRGAVTAALAISLPETLTGWWTAQAMGYGVVLFTLFFQGPVLARLLRISR